MGKPKVQHTPEQKLKIAKAICEEYAKGESTIASCIGNQNITERTFGYWCADIADIAAMYKEAKIQADKTQRMVLKQLALTSLGKLVLGHEHEETHQEGEVDENGNIKTTKVRKVKKYYPPQTTAVIFALKHLDERFKEDGGGELQAADQVFVVDGREIKF